MAANGLSAKEDDLESIEILSAQYRPTHSVVNHGPPDKYSAVNGRRRSSTTDEIPVIRSVDDYEKESTYYFRPGTTGSSSSNRPGGTNAGQLRSAGRRRSETLLTTGTVAPDSSKSNLIAVPIYNGDTVLVDTSCKPSASKEPITAEERKRKRITLAVGIIAGLIICASIFLVAVTLNMTGRIDAIVKEQSDTLYAQLTASGGDYGLSWKNASSAQNYPVLQYAARDNR